MNLTPIRNSSSGHTLVLDQGSHASRMAIFSAQGTLIQLESTDVSTEHPRTDCFEQNANEILTSLQTLLERLEPAQISAIKSCGLCTQRSTVVAWHRKTGQVLSPALSWRDLRAQQLINQLKADAHDCQQITGLPLSPHYSAGKIHWLLQNTPQVRQARDDMQLCIAPLSSFLLFHLLQESPCVIDHSNAQRSQLFDIQTLDWSDKLLKLFQINRQCLPQCKPLVHPYGQLKISGIALTAVCGDQNSIMHAYPQLSNNNTLINIGTGAFVLSRLTEQKKQPPGNAKLLRSIVYSQQEMIKFATEGTVNGAGAALNWALENDPCEDIFKNLAGWLNEITEPPIFINTVAGLGSPWWCAAREILSGEILSGEILSGEILSGEMHPSEVHYIGQNTHLQSHRYVAIIESICFLIFTNLEHLSTPTTLQHAEVLFISGGLSRLDGLCQKLADLSQLNITRFKDTEASARGCAWLAGQLSENSCINWQPLEISHRFKPSDNPLLHKRYKRFVGELRKRCNKH